MDDNLYSYTDGPDLNISLTRDGHTIAVLRASGDLGRQEADRLVNELNAIAKIKSVVATRWDYGFEGALKEIEAILNKVA